MTHGKALFWVRAMNDKSYDKEVMLVTRYWILDARCWIN
jgi:hypothetical protein